MISNRQNGKGPDYFNDNIAVEAKNINHNSKPLGRTFILKEVVLRFNNHEDKLKVLINSAEVDNTGLSILEKNKIRMIKVPYQVTKDLSFKKRCRAKKSIIFGNGVLSLAKSL